MDSSIIISFLKKAIPKELILDSIGLYVSSISVFETAYGELFLEAKGQKSLMKELYSFFDNVNVIAIDFIQAQKASELKAVLKVKGISINDFDLFILALGITKNVPIYTLDSDFELAKDVLELIYNYDKIVLVKQE